MNQEEAVALVTVRRKESFFRRVGGGSLAVSLTVHGVLLLVGVFWIMNIIPPEAEKTVDFRQSGSSGGSGGERTKVSLQKQRQQMISAHASRVSAVGISSTLTLPEPDPSNALSSLSALGGSMAGGGGMGKMEGLGNGLGSGNGSGMGAGMGNGIAKGMNAFGMLDATVNALEGTFYDFKQTQNRKPTDISNGEMLEVIREFVNSGWKERSQLRSYFKAPQRLFQTKIFIPNMPAAEAPAAFNCEKDVEPRRWMIVYRGSVTPPVTGEYRFVGGADDILAVRFNERNVFDHGYFSATTGLHIRTMREIMGGDPKDAAKQLKDLPMKLPVSFLKYETTPVWNGGIGGMAVGPVFQAKAGVSYPIEILMAEVPGGSFGATLLIERIGEKYEETSSGVPILPLFNLDFKKPAKVEGEVPPYDEKAQPWKVTGGVRPQLSDAAR